MIVPIVHTITLDQAKITRATGNWIWRKAESILKHKDFCNSGQLVTKMQLVHDPEFVKSQKLDKLSIDKEAVKLTLGYNGRLSGSV